MESQVQETQYADSTSPEAIKASAEPGAPLAKLPPAPQSNEQWRQVGAQVSIFLRDLPKYISGFFNQYQQQIIVVALLIAGVISVKVVLAVLDALNDIPLLAPTFELIGIGYSIWFANRYLLAASKRQELSGELDSLWQQVVGSQKLPE